MKILLTGSQGFIGLQAKLQLEANGHEVDGLDVLLEQVHGVTSLPYGVRRVLVSDFCRDNPCTYEAVIHLAAHVGVAQSMYDIVDYVRLNTLDTAALLQWMATAKRRPKKLIVASSMSIYGEGEYQMPGGAMISSARGGLIRAPQRGLDAFDWIDAWRKNRSADGATPQPTREWKVAEPASVYAMTKYDQECYSRIVGKAYGIETVALRFFGTYGPGQSLSNPYTGVLAIFCSRLMNNLPPVVYEDGRQVRDFIYVGDVANAVVSALDAPPGVYNVSTGVPTTVAELAEVCCAVAAERGYAVQEPVINGMVRAGDIRHCYGSHTAFTKATGWEPIMPLALGVVGTVDWMQTQPTPETRAAEAHQELEAHGLTLPGPAGETGSRADG